MSKRTRKKQIRRAAAMQRDGGKITYEQGIPVDELFSSVVSANQFPARQERDNGESLVLCRGQEFHP